jgi:hypothetical protein
VEVLRGRPAGWTDSFPSRASTLLAFLKPAGREVHFDDLWLTDPVPFFAGIADATFRGHDHRTPRQRVPALEEARDA